MPTAIDWNEIITIAGSEGEFVLSIIQPFLPALARAGAEVYAGFLQHLGEGDIDSMTELMYPHMTVKEREALESTVYTQAVEAAQASYDRVQLIKSIAIKLVLGILMRVVTGGVI